MNLLSLLASGVNGAANGSVDIFKRGTSTYAQIFTTYDGQGASTPSASLSLDANGGRVVFVNEEVDLVVKDSSGNILRSTNPMATATNVEYIGPAFTGTDYTTGQSGASKPVTLQDILSRWLTNSGAIDWKVNVGGVATDLQTAFSAVSGLYFNVKSTTYGAKGDGTTDDTSAIQAAITAAQAFPGGTVFFPGGNYRITATLTVSSAVSLLGAGARAVNILIDHATSNAITFSATGANNQNTMRGLSVLPLQSNSGKMVVVEGGTSVNISDCLIGGALLTGFGVSFDNANTKLVLIGNTIITGGAASYCVYNDTGTPTCILIGNRFITPATHNGDAVHVNGGKSIIVGNIIDCSGTSAGAGTGISAAGSYTIAGNRFNAPTGGTIQPIVTTSSAGGNFVGLNSRAQSSFWSVQGLAITSALQTTHEGGEELDRASRSYHTTDNTTPISVDGSIYGVAEVRRTNNANQTVNGTTPPAPGLDFSLVINNDQVGVSGTITLGANFKGQAPFTVAANNVRSLTFRSYEATAAGGASAVKYWGFVGSTGDVTP